MLKRIVMVTRRHPRVLLILLLLMLAPALGPGIGRSALAQEQDGPSGLSVEVQGCQEEWWILWGSQFTMPK